ncbi:TRIC cation channel family protein [Azospirillum sp. TSO22-1]|uniref:trimeric intracellular cation channel family protein n=1 Tax=Azospirillum sp. TSO22-1 TaxID=716789 RepID=UPI0013048A5D|nr:TRIC cation channel family protein [Azospirillum sp. TSO22-1]
MDLSASLDQVVSSHWFITIDLIGTVAFALSGITIARSERYSMLGAFVLAWLPALGGGLVMDLIAGRVPPGIMAQPSYMYAIIATVLVARGVLWLIDRARGRWLFFFDVVHWYLMVARRVPPTTLLVVFDAVGLAGFTVTGVFTAVQFHCHPLELWGPAFAMMNASLGAILRDVVRADAHNPILKGSVYAEIAVAGGLALSLYVQAAPVWALGYGVVATLVALPVVRVLLYRREARAPMF